MIDREKVIKGLECCLRGIERADRNTCFDCPYADCVIGNDCTDDLKTEALALLKEQDAVEPVTETSVYDPDTWFFVCGSCKKGVIDHGDKFCRWCGQTVKWE